MRWVEIALVAGLAIGCSGAHPPLGPDEVQESCWDVIDPVETPSPLLRQALESARQAGTTAGGQIALDTGSTGDRITRLIQVPPTECGLLLARAGPSVVDVDLFAFGDDGAALGADERADKTPVLLVCPPHPNRIVVSARIAGGYGPVAIAALSVPPDQAAHVAERLGVTGVPGGPPPTQIWPGLDDQVDRHRREVGGQWVEVRRTVIPLEPLAATRISAAIEGTGCLDVLIVPAPEVSHLDASLQTFDGRVVGRAVAAGRSRSIVACAETDTPVTLSVRPRGGRGLAALVLARTQDHLPHGSQNVLHLHATPPGTVGDVSTRLADRLERYGYGEPQHVATGSLVQGQRETVSVPLPGGCSRIDAIVGHPARGVQAWLWSASEQLIGEARGGENAAIIACARQQRARLDLEPVTNGGPFVVQLRTDPHSPEILERHSLAASRLIQRLIERGVLQRAEQLRAAEPVQLDPTRLTQRDLLVPVGRCVEIGVGLGPEAVGVELRLVDGDSGSEIELVRGTTAAAARACALDRGRTLNARAELRTTTDSASALIATRMLAPLK